MKFAWAVALGIVLLVGQAKAEEQAAPKTEKEKLSYSMGVDFGTYLKRQAVDVDLELLLRGVKDVFSGRSFLLSDEEMNAVKNAFSQQMMLKQAEETKKLAEKNKKEGETFLEANKAKEGVKTLPSGLQYKMITEGTGKSPKATDTVTVNYRGTFVDGTEFDNSYKRGQPVTFQLNAVIAGWTEALQLLKEGAKCQLFIPSNLAYGEKGAGGIIGPNATLIFDVELLSVK